MSFGAHPHDPTVARRSDNEIIGEPPTRIRLIADSSANGGALSVVAVQLDPDTDGAQPHHHTRSAELFYVLGGQVEVLAGDQILRAAQGDTVVIPPMLPHAFSAVEGEGTELLVVITPGVERFEYFRHLARLVRGTATIESLLEVQDLYDNHFDDSPVWRSRRETHRTEWT
jgi:quercetin dioxygenase-like cupin family protein